MTAIDAAKVGSPCTGICRIDPATGRCEGCRRTLAEIAAWTALDDSAKRAVWADLPRRGMDGDRDCGGMRGPGREPTR